MLLRWLNPLLLVTLAALSMTALYLGRKPLCIHSMVVERIDRVTSAGVESAFHCSLNREPSLSPALNRLVHSLENRLDGVENDLNRLAPFQSTIRIVVMSERPWIFGLDRGTLFIGEKLLSVDGSVERGLMKSWLRSHSPSQNKGSLFEEVQSDLLADLINRQPRLAFLPDLEPAYWPHVLRGSEAYCHSADRWLEHIEDCEINASSFERSSLLVSLRPLLSQSLIAAWSQQPLAVRLRALRQLPEWLASQKMEQPLPSSSGILSSIFQRVLSFHQEIARSAAKMSGGEMSAIAAAFTQELRYRGFSDANPDLSLDVLVVADERLEDPKELLKSLRLASQNEPRLKIAFKDSHSLWMLPSDQKIPLSGSVGLRSERLVILKCGSYDFDWVLSFEAMTQKLFVVDSCGGQALDLRSWVRDGAEGFARANREIRFVQFHLPSLALKKEELNRTSDVFSTIKKRDVTDPVFQLLGWQELNWSEQIGAYHPKAYLDAIEWFRLN